MTSRGRRAASLLIWLVCLPVSVLTANQDPFSKARELYLSADYEGALAILEHANVDQGSTASEAAVYRVFCLLALDRVNDARAAITAMVQRDPTYRLPEGQASPRVEAMFQEIRKAALPAVAQSMYADAKSAFDRHDADAGERFDRLIELLNDPDLKNASVSDLRSVAIGFRDLTLVSRQSSVEQSLVQQSPSIQQLSVDESSVQQSALVDPQPKASPEAAATVTTASAGTGNEVATGTREARLEPGVISRLLTGPPDQVRVTRKGASRLFTAKEPPPPGVEPPLAVEQSFPSWSPRGMSAQQTYTGVLEVTIDETGRVTTVALQQPTQPDFDKALVKVARTWKFKPALFNGIPVSFVKVVEIHVQPEP